MTRTAAIAAAAILAGAGPAAAACTADKPAADLTAADAQALYDCLSADMQAGYAQGDSRWIPSEFITGYPDWKTASVFPAAPGFHGNRYLVTRVSPEGYDAYTEFAAEGVEIPAGATIAKESFTVSEDGTASAGPLFLMHKVAEGASPRTDDWHYMMVAPNGQPQAVPVVEACHACHSSWPGQDNLGYPVPEARVN
jgi:poly(3-hydroxybutyrate) depolymerase